MCAKPSPEPRSGDGSALASRLRGIADDSHPKSSSAGLQELALHCLAAAAVFRLDGVGEGEEAPEQGFCFFGVDDGPRAARRLEVARLLCNQAGVAKARQTPIHRRLRKTRERLQEGCLGRRLAEQLHEERDADSVESLKQKDCPVVHLLCTFCIVVEGRACKLARTPKATMNDAAHSEMQSAPALAPTLFDLPPDRGLLDERIARYPRMRFMGSKYKLAPRLAEVFESLPPGPAVDAFSGSGVVSYTLKATGRDVVSNDQLAFAVAIAQAVVANDDEKLSAEDVARICSPNRDGRSFIATTFDGLYFPAQDHAFLDAAWSHIDLLAGNKRALALSALCLAAAWKQPRGVFTITTPRYDDGRRQMRMSLEALFREAVEHFNRAVFAGTGTGSRAVLGDVFALDPEGVAVAYLDPPYAPPKDDTCYIKRYHFLEGLATYWRGQEIMWETKTRKLRKRHTPFAYKRSIRPALDQVFDHFRDAALVVSYGSNAVPDADELEGMLRRHKRFVRRIEIPHRYAFGTHAAASRRVAMEYVFLAT